MADEAANEAWLLQSSLWEEAREKVRARVWDKRPEPREFEAPTEE